MDTWESRVLVWARWLWRHGFCVAYKHWCPWCRPQRSLFQAKTKSLPRCNLIACNDVVTEVTLIRKETVKYERSDDGKAHSLITGAEIYNDDVVFGLSEAAGFDSFKQMAVNFKVCHIERLVKMGKPWRLQHVASCILMIFFLPNMVFVAPVSPTTCPYSPCLFTDHIPYKIVMKQHPYNWEEHVNRKPKSILRTFWRLFFVPRVLYWFCCADLEFSPVLLTLTYLLEHG